MQIVCLTDIVCLADKNTKCQALFSQKNKYFRMSSAAVVIGTLTIYTTLSWQIQQTLIVNIFLIFPRKQA